MKAQSSAAHDAPNAHRLLWAGFMAILAAGVGFAIRGGILDNWKREFGFTDGQVGDINGFGFTGFCFGIILGGVVADKIGYGKLVIAAFLFHVLSAFVTFAAGGGTENQAMAYQLLMWGSFIFAFANGTLEAVANPLVATVFPSNRTHYLNILHASWPAGLVLGSAMGWILDDRFELDWRIQLGLYLIPVALYGLMFLGQHMPKSEASKQGLSLGEMFKDVGLLGGFVVCFLLWQFTANLFAPYFAIDSFLGKSLGGGDIVPWIPTVLGAIVAATIWIGIGVITNFSIGSPLLFILFVTHALVGAVELGTDGWIQNITGNILTSEQGKFLFVFTSSVMFILRFCAEFIEKKIGISPLGILLICAVLAAIGLNLTSMANSFVIAALALTVYGVGKTFFWPTMLAVGSDRFPRSGAVAISMMGGIGMLSAGLIGSPGLGYFKDRYAAEELKQADPKLFDEYKAAKPSKFLFFPAVDALDGKKLGAATEAVQKESSTKEKVGAERVTATPEQHTAAAASIKGDRRTLVTDSFIPMTMAVIYLGLMLYFRTIGGYRPVTLKELQGESISGTDLGTAES
jgi:MFS family permease